MRITTDTSSHVHHRSVRVVGAFLSGFVAVAAVLVATTSPAHASSADDLSLGSMYNVVDQIGARDLWNRGFTGRGINVAIIDTGITPVGALSTPGKVVAAVDLSGEGHLVEARNLDTYGHGTHIAGIIAGRQPGRNPRDADEHPGWFMGVAPGAGLVSVKVADNTGATDISQVIAGVDWVTDHAAELDIRVLNLSYASGSPLPYSSDPLAYAVERAWKAGIVVVVSAGNGGNLSSTLTSPALDPYVIAVAAVEATGDDSFTAPEWASSGDGVRNPDVAAPGAHIESLRVPGSRVDQEHPEGYVSDTLFKGSGSSQAAAVVSGAAALLLDARPNLTNDQVKALLQRRTVPATPTNPLLSGTGVVQVDRVYDRFVGASTQSWAPAVGDGSLEAARNGQHVTVNGVTVTGEVTVLGTSWSGTSWSDARWSGTSWSGTSWSGGSWMGTSWSGTSWSGTSWSGTSWSGTSWSGTSWSGTSWSGTSWSGTSWSGTSWSGTSWSGTSWSGTSWTGTSWS